MAAAAGQRVWHVLVVDDEENLNWSLVTSLRKDNYAADGAMTGEDALRRLASQNYDIVISDVKMPGMDGFELLQWLRTHRPHTRVIMMTAFGSPTDRADAIRGGVIAYLEKPFDLRALKEELRRLTTPASDQRPSGPGEPEGYDLLEVARVISLARRDIALVVESGGRTGRLRFLRGDLIWAEAGDLQGDEAFVALTAPRIGRVQPELWDGRSARNVMQPLARLIYLALAQRDRPASLDAGANPPRVTPVTAAESGPAGQAQPSTPAAPPAPSQTGAPASADVRSSTGRPSPGPAAPAGAPQPQVPNGPPPSTVPLAPLSPAQIGAARTALDTLAHTLPKSGGAALLRPDGTIVAQSWVGVPDASGGTLGHLAASMQAALRALLLGGWGDLEDMQVTSADRVLVLRRLGRSERAAVLIIVVPRGADLASCRETMAVHVPALGQALH